MANRYESDERSRRERYHDRQEQQFQPRHQDDDDHWYGQMGDAWRDRDDFGRDDRGDRYERSRDYRGSRGVYGTDRDRSPSFDRSRGTRSALDQAYASTQRGAGSQLAANHGEWREPSREHRDYRGTWGGLASSRPRDPNERSFFEKAGDTIAHWLGDEADYGRGERGFRGRGPANYTRSDERIRDDANDRLTEDWHVDASRIEVAVENGEITLTGTVSSRAQKRRAEDCVEDLSGVRHVQNNLRVEDGNWNRSGGQSDPTSTQA